MLRGALERCVAYLDDHPEVGVVGPQLLNPDRSKQNCIHNSPTVLSELFSQSLLRRLWPTRYPGRRVEYSAPIEVEAVLGACLFARREVIEQVGPLDEEYFFQLEDTDWCHRVRAAEWKVVHDPEGVDLLFRLSGDPFELHPVADEHPEVAQRLREQLLDRVEQQKARRAQLRLSEEGS